MQDSGSLKCDHLVDANACLNDNNLNFVVLGYWLFNMATDDTVKAEAAQKMETCLGSDYMTEMMIIEATI